MTKPQLILALRSHQKKSRIAKAVPRRAEAARPQAGRAGAARTSAAVHPTKNYDDLPWSYGETELGLMPVDPFRIYAYWDFSPEDWNAVCARGRPVVLRVYDVTMIRFDGANAHSHFDVPVRLETQRWYIPLWSAEKSLCAELGWLLPDGSFQRIIRSNVVQTPRAGVSIFEDARWVEIRWTRRRPGRFVRRQRPGTGLPPGLRRTLEAQAAAITASGAGSSSAGPIGTKPRFKPPG